MVDTFRLLHKGSHTCHHTNQRRRSLCRFRTESLCDISRELLSYRVRLKGHVSLTNIANNSLFGHHLNQGTYQTQSRSWWYSSFPSSSSTTKYLPEQKQLILTLFYEDDKLFGINSSAPVDDVTQETRGNTLYVDMLSLTMMIAWRRCKWCRDNFIQNPCSTFLFLENASHKQEEYHEVNLWLAKLLLRGTQASSHKQRYSHDMDHKDTSHVSQELWCWLFRGMKSIFPLGDSSLGYSFRRLIPVCVLWGLINLTTLHKR